MIPLPSIFSKIKEDFYKNHISGNEKREEYKLIFSPFSTGFNYDDFLFLDTNNAADDAHKYLDELYEFSQIANTLPKQDKYWTISGEQQDYLYNPYATVLNHLRLLDPDSLNIEMLYEHPIFSKALNAVKEPEKDTYRAFLKLRKKITGDIANLQEKVSESKAATEVEINMKKENLKTIEKEWKEKGNKESIEEQILEIVKDEFKRFLTRLNNTKGKLESLKREHLGSGANFHLTSCMPNNLYKGDELNWKKISLKSQDLKNSIKENDLEEFKEIFNNSVTELELESIDFEILFVNITRAWYDGSILTSPFWNINLLNQEEINIPRITQKLIFIRNIDIKLPEKSKKNEELLTDSKIKNLGPFIINKKFKGKDKRLQLQSVNKGLKIERNTILNVSSKINEKRNQKPRKIQSLISKKQNQFVKLAPRLNKKVRVKAKLAQKMMQVKAKPIVRDHRQKPASRDKQQHTRKKEETETSETFQLIGVVAKQIASFPNPIQKADYL